MQKPPFFYFSLYIVAILSINIGFSYVPMIDLGFGLFSPMAILAGAVLVLRDYGQRENGHWILVGMAIGAILSYVLADPAVATASVVAFVFSETVDWLIYTVTKRPFYKRVFYSVGASAPVDTFVFLYMIDGITMGTFWLMVGAKMLAAIVVWLKRPVDTCAPVNDI